ncbi:MAG: hypothetical protein KFH98_14860 [Gemmatimonadetes bacterium]|nr:hypothetical protein [Gemmatimonadota bacterium]
MKFSTAGLAMFLVATAVPAAAQQPLGTPVSVTTSVEDVIEQSGIVAALDSVMAVSSPELERSLGELAETLETVGRRLASDPQLRLSALRAAQGLTSVAQVMLVEHSRALEEALRAAVERLGELSARQEAAIPPDDDGSLPR